MTKFEKEVISYLKVIVVFLFFIVFVILVKFFTVDTVSVNAGSRWMDVNIAAISGEALYSKAIPTK